MKKQKNVDGNSSSSSSSSSGGIVVHIIVQIISAKKLFLNEQISGLLFFESVQNISEKTTTEKHFCRNILDFLDFFSQIEGVILLVEI